MIRTGVFLWTTNNILNFLKEVAIDTWHVVEPQIASCEDMIFIFPNVPLSGLTELKEELLTMAGAPSIDMSCLVYGHDRDGVETVSERWKFGFSDGSSSIFVRIYPQEYFRSKNDLSKLLAETFL